MVNQDCQSESLLPRQRPEPGPRTPREQLIEHLAILVLSAHRRSQHLIERPESESQIFGRHRFDDDHKGASLVNLN